LYDYAVLGMGVVGLAVSIRLSSHGYKTILIGESKSASTSSAGVITVQLENIQDILLVKKNIEIIEEFLEKYGGEDAGIVGREFISIENLEDAEESRNLLEKAGVRFKQLASKEALEVWPYFNISEDEIVTHTFEDMSIEAEKFIEYLLKIARENDVELKISKVLQVKLDETPEIVLEDHSTLNSQTVILCLGAWTRKFLENLGIFIPIVTLCCPAYRFRVKEKITAFADEVYESYWRPGFSNTIVGGGYHAEIVNDPRDFFKKPPEKFRRSAEKLLKERVKMDVEFIEEWTGPCSVTPDLDPVIDKIPGSSIFFVDGLRGYGFMRGMTIGYLLADVLVGRESPENIERYSLRRFQGLL